jgi:hypothetical protein
MTVLGTLLMKIINGRSAAQGRGRDTRWSWIRFLEDLGGGEQLLFLLTPSYMNAGSVVDWATIHALVVGKLPRCNYIKFTKFSLHTSTLMFVSNFVLFSFRYSCSFQIFCRMAQFHLLDQVYDQHHRGRLVAEGQVWVAFFNYFLFPHVVCMMKLLHSNL